MSSRDKGSKTTSRAKQPSQRHKSTAPRNPHVGAIVSGSSSSSEDGRRKNSSTRPRPKMSAKDGKSAKSRVSLSIDLDKTTDDGGDLSEMTTSSYKAAIEDCAVKEGSDELEQETDLDVDTLVEERESLISPGSASDVSHHARTSLHKVNDESEKLPKGWEKYSDQAGDCYWHVASGKMQKFPPSDSQNPTDGPVVLYHDDEEINQAPKNSSDDDEYIESGAALTIDDSSESTFVVYPLGCCEFDETQLVSTTSTKSIQKCILRLSNKPTKEESYCWGLDQSQPILMRLFEDYIQFTDLKSRTLLRSQPIHAIKTWAVDDDNNFAFVVEDSSPQDPSDGTLYESVDYALLSEPPMRCYVFRSIDDDDMSCKVASKLNEEITRFREQMSYRISKSTRMQQMIDTTTNKIDDPTDNEDFDDLEASNELTMHVKYIGQTSVPRPVGIDVLNVAIDKCLAEASKVHASRMAEFSEDEEALSGRFDSGLMDVKLHVSPSSVIVENELTGEIMVECRIRYLTFMGISRRDIRWCGFIMQNTTNKTFVAHCFECHPTAGHVCEAIQASCTKMYNRVVKTSRQQETESIVPTRYNIRDTLAKTFSRIKLNPIR